LIEMTMKDWMGKRIPHHDGGGGGGPHHGSPADAGERRPLPRREFRVAARGSVARTTRRWPPRRYRGPSSPTYPSAPTPGHAGSSKRATRSCRGGQPRRGPQCPRLGSWTWAVALCPDREHIGPARPRSGGKRPSTCQARRPGPATRRPARSSPSATQPCRTSASWLNASPSCTG